MAVGEVQRRSGAPTAWRTAIVCATAAALALVAASCSSPTRAAPEPAPATAPATLPTAWQVVDHYVQVTGGWEAYSSIRNRRLEGVVEIAAQGVKGATVTVVEYGRGQQRFTLDGVGTFVQGFLGDVAYVSDPNSGARLLRGEDAWAAIQQLTINAEIDLKGYVDARVTGIELIRGRPCYRVEVAAITGVKLSRFYEIESGLLVRAEAPVPSLGQNVPMIVTYGDYQLTPPIRRPMFTRMQLGQPAMLVVETSFSKVEHNVEVTDADFEPPPEVKKLLAPATQESP